MVSSGKHFPTPSSQAENSTGAISRVWYRDVVPWGLNSINCKSKCLWPQIVLGQPNSGIPEDRNTHIFLVYF